MPDAGRVVTGSAKGTRLLGPGAGTRPLSDRVKQALFGVLVAEGVVGEESSFLDLFAGSGAAGIEALSRGAEIAVFVERDARAAAVIESNLARSGLTGGHVVRADVLRFLAGPASDQPPARDTPGVPFAAALIDPPYEEPLLAPALERLGDRRAGWLSEDAIVVAKHFWRDAPPPAAGRLAAFRERRFGETMLTFYRLTEEP